MDLENRLEKVKNFLVTAIISYGSFKIGYDLGADNIENLWTGMTIGLIGGVIYDQYEGNRKKIVNYFSKKGIN